jgi:hypothetical protein
MGLLSLSKRNMPQTYYLGLPDHHKIKLKQSFPRIQHFKTARSQGRLKPITFE